MSLPALCHSIPSRLLLLLNPAGSLSLSALLVYRRRKPVLRHAVFLGLLVASRSKDKFHKHGEAISNTFETSIL